MREQQLAATWMRELEAVAARIGAFVARPASRDRLRRYMRVTVTGDARQNGWQLAEAAGEAPPHGMQRLVASAAWDVDGVRDDLRAYVTNALGTHDGVLIVDETGFLKKGTKSAGVQRQYSGTAGRIENCQIGVFLAYATARGHAFVDRALYVPESWIRDRSRCREAGIPDAVAFQTKPQLAQTMLARPLPMHCRRRRGAAAVRGPAAKARAPTTGQWCPSCASPVGGGPSNKASRRASRRSAWMNTKSARTTRGTAS